MNYEILAKTLFVRKKFSRSIWKSELVVINSDAGFVKVDTSNLVEAVIRKLKTSVPFMISPSSHWVRLFFFSRRYNEVKQFKRYFVSLSRMSSSLSFATRLKSLRFCAAFLTRVCSFSIWHLWRFFRSSLLQQKIHSFKVFLKSRLFFFFFLPSFLSSNSCCSYQIYLHSRFPLIFVFNFVCYMLQYTTCEIKLYFQEKLLQVLTYFVEHYIFYLKHLVNHQNSGTHWNCRLSYGTNFFQGQNLKNKYCVLNTNFQLQILLFLPSKCQKIIWIFCRYNILTLQLVLYFLEWHKLDWIDITEMTNL